MLRGQGHMARKRPGHSFMHSALEDEVLRGHRVLGTVWEPRGQGQPCPRPSRRLPPPPGGPYPAGLLFRVLGRRQAWGWAQADPQRAALKLGPGHRWGRRGAEPRLQMQFLP